MSRGAYVNVKDKNDKSPLHEAAFHGRARTCEVLAKSGAKVDALDNEANEPGEVFSDSVSSEDQAAVLRALGR